MVTRQLCADLPLTWTPDAVLSHPDSQAALTLMRTAVTSCRFEDPAQAVALWSRWLMSCTVLGTFGDEGTLIALRPYERLEDGTTLRQRGLVCAAAALTPAGDGVAPRILRGALTWYRAVGAVRIVVPLVSSLGAPLTGTALEPWQAWATRVGGRLVPGFGGAAAALVYEVDELERRLPGWEASDAR